MLHNLEKEIDDVDAKIGDRWQLLDRYSIGSVISTSQDYDGKVNLKKPGPIILQIWL